ncbi:DoxX family protein [Marinoscillum sp. 108]|uniref:DoxX family protein n=1 Tax=Marinoscillum sp. 108 TaxID=2653151 RepID=UPI0012F31CEB|nr:DoxX family protein [Marinoscillum sp. 108]VXD11835.1 DoxX-like family protein [Marinoscillum sp. 108]
MKNLNIYYWISIGLILFFLVPGSIMNIMKSPDWVEVFTQLGYPEYLLPFLGVAKLSGCIALVLPKFNRLKEWAYAGLFFDLIGATYSGLMVGGFEPAMLIMFVAIATVLISYWLWHKKLAQG